MMYIIKTRNKKLSTAFLSSIINTQATGESNRMLKDAWLNTTVTQNLNNKN
jgi:transposase-like protein